MINLFSNEVIDFRTNSAFATELTNIFQECIEKRESIQDVKTRIKEVPKFFTDKSVSKIKAAIKKHTGLTCEKIVVSKHLSTCYACLMNFGDNEGVTSYDVIQRYSGLETPYMVKQYMDYKKIKPATAAEMQVIADSLNRETGLFGVDKFRDNIKCTMTLFFDPYTSFLVKECGHERLEYLLAPEITAIVLHEIGHMVSTLAHAADRCFRVQVYNRALEYFTQAASIEEKSKYAKSLLSKINDTKLSDQACKSIDQCTAVDKHSGSGSWVANAFNIFINLLLSVAAAAGGAAALAIDAVLVYPLQELIDYRNIKFGDNGKLSDIGPSGKGAKVCEQFADEYVAKHGMSSWQISGLRKIFDIAFTSGVGGLLDARSGAISYYVAKIPFIVNTVFCGDLTNGGGLYDFQYQRGVHLMQELLKSFKSSNMSPEMVAFFVADYERCKKELTNKSGAIKLQNASQAFRDAVRYLASTLPAMLFTGRFTREYEILINKIETLTSNNLFYHATKLSMLKNK